MTAWVLPMSGASPTRRTAWNQIDWSKAEKQVRRLQMRIAKAIQQGKRGKAKALQWILSHSFYAKLLAVKRVTKNTGAKTPGIDGVIWTTPGQKYQAATSLHRRGYQAQPLRRIYIPKKNGKQRPLGIPTMADRAMQALYLLALEPIAEITADKHSYGFRPARSTADAIGQCFLSLCRKTSAQWVLEGDIKACFDQIDHRWLIEHIPTDKTILQQWLAVGYIEKGTFYDTEAGTPQGGIASPTMANMALDGLEQIVKQTTCPTDKINVIRYADDFVVTGRSRAILEQQVKPAIVDFLSQRGLSLSEEKTHITHIDSGFDFLGFNLRKYNGKLLIKPAKSNVKAFLAEMRAIIKSNPTIKTDSLIRLLNPKLRGWANYYRHVVSKAVFAKVDTAIFEALYRWAKRRHPHKGGKWLYGNYFQHPPPNNWWFHTKVRDGNNQPGYFRLFRLATVKIERHVKIRAEATPFDSAYITYFDQRKKRRSKRKQAVWNPRKPVDAGS